MTRGIEFEPLLTFTPVMEFRYGDELSELENCPPTHHPRADGFRWVNQPYLESDFEPLASQSEMSCENCSRWGLSMHVSEESSLRAYQKKLRQLSKKQASFREARKRLPFTHIAKIEFVNGDGVTSKPKHGSHFNFFPARDVNLTQKFEVVASLEDCPEMGA